MHRSNSSTSTRSLRRSKHSSRSGATLVEVLIGTAVAATGLAGLCLANAECIGIARSHREMLIADQCLQQRAEQFRNASWTQLTDPASACALLNQTTANGTPLQDQVETVTISAYPVPMPVNPPLTLQRLGSAAPAVISQPPAGFTLRGSIAVRIDLQESWTSAQGKRSRTKAASTVVALGGLLH